ncbi:hypothetical protein [Desulfogranum japonicum]|uniref:hypothetical protein n=1 Tax=Desulfogranum japonicum TaxID=231447 RepID=UPI00041470EA|nr:hypothetical protein [Desulfogranum japonicum]
MKLCPYLLTFVCSFVFIATLSGFCAANVHTPQEAAVLVEDVFADDDFGTTKEVTRWVPIEKEKKLEKDSSWDRFFEWLGEKVRKLFTGISEYHFSLARLFKLLVCILFGLGLGYLGYRYRHLIPLDRWHGSQRRVVSTPEMLFGLDVRPESLPDDIVAVCRKMLEKKEFRQAIGLLYRSSLSWMVHRQNMVLEGSMTEKECEAMVSLGRPDAEAAYFQTLTEHWIRTAYGHQVFEPEIYHTLLTGWKQYYGDLKI